MTQLLVFVPGLSLLGYCTVLARYSRFKIETTPFFVITTVIALLYIAAMLNVLQMATNILLFTGCAALLLSPFYLNYRDSNIFEDYLVPGFIIPLVFILIFSFFVYPMHFHIWDEFAFWGPHAKLIHYNNGLITASQHAVHKSYPPASPLFYYYFFRLTGYSEGVAYVAQGILLFSPLSILLQGFSWKKVVNAGIFYAVVFFALILYLRIFTYRHQPIDICMDSVVGVFLGISLTYYFQSPRKAENIIYLIPIFFTLVLLKIKLMPLVLLALLLIFFDQLAIFHRERTRQTKGSKALLWQLCKRVCAFALLVISPFFAKSSWQHYLTRMHVAIERKLNLSISSIASTVIFNVSDKERLVLHAFMAHAVHALPKLFFLLGLIVLAYFLNRKREEGIEFLFVHVYMLLGFTAYLFGLLLLYSYVFSYNEAIVVASFDRYLKIYYIAWFLLISGGFSQFLRLSPLANSRKFQIPFAFITILAILNALHFHPPTYFKGKEKNMRTLRMVKHNIQSNRQLGE